MRATKAFQGGLQGCQKKGKKFSAGSVVGEASGIIRVASRRAGVAYAYSTVARDVPLVPATAVSLRSFSAPMASPESLKILRELQSHPDNKVCCDCNSKNPQWASVSYGCFMYVAVPAAQSREAVFCRSCRAVSVVPYLSRARLLVYMVQDARYMMHGFL